jgi:hypothetical protein
MGRFDRDKIGIEGLSASLDSATEEIRATVERQLREIVSVAEEKAAEIEQRALENADRAEREAIRRRDEVFETGVNRAYQMLEAIDALERDVARVVASLRAEAENLTTELEAAKNEAASSSVPGEEAEEPTLDGDDAPAEPEVAIDEDLPEYDVEEDLPEDDFATPESFPEAAAVEESDRGPVNAEVRDIVRLQLVTLFQSGKPRADAERFLTRFKEGHKFHDLIDEIYSQGDESKPSASRRRRLRRRRAKQQHEADED